MKRGFIKLPVTFLHGFVALFFATTAFKIYLQQSLSSYLFYQAKTAHSLNPVPFIIYDPAYNNEYSKQLKEGLGISSIAATCMNLMGFDAPDDYDPSIIDLH